MANGLGGVLTVDGKDYHITDMNYSVQSEKYNSNNWWLLGPNILETLTIHCVMYPDQETERDPAIIVERLETWKI